MIMSKLAIFNRNQLKYICAAGMVLDSLFFAFPGVFPVEFRLLSRYVAPLFAFFVAEGFRLSRNKEKYLIRLWIGGLVMVASQILSFFVLGAQNAIPDNIILTFAIAATALYFLDKEKSDGNHLPCFISIEISHSIVFNRIHQLHILIISRNQFFIFMFSYLTAPI